MTMVQYLGLLRSDTVNVECSLNIEQQTEELVGLGDLNDIWTRGKIFFFLISIRSPKKGTKRNSFHHQLTHKSTREGRISADLAVNLHQTLHEDHNHLTSGQSVT